MMRCNKCNTFIPNGAVCPRCSVSKKKAKGISNKEILQRQKESVLKEMLAGKLIIEFNPQMQRWCIKRRAKISTVKADFYSLNDLSHWIDDILTEVTIKEEGISVDA